MNTRDTDALEGIAVIGMSGRFPGASSVAQLWENLCQGKESISKFTVEELEEAGVNPAIIEDPNFVPVGGVVDNIEQFDARFFGYSPRDSELLDPQQRLFLECAWEGLEDAGYVADKFDGLIGAFGGASASTYALNLFGHGQELGFDDFEILIGNGKDYVCTRASYKLNLTGPSVTVQTACSTSLVAIYMAAQSLRNYECDMALAGGASIRVPQKQGYIYHEGGISSPDGHCRAFDASAKGTVGGDGVAVVVLKRLSEAVADCDRIYAVLRGVAANNDGTSKIGFTAPSVRGQSMVIATAQAQAGVAPDTIGCVEAHGTATPLGDPIEISALRQIFANSDAKPQSCAVGSIKTNIGHLDAAAGAAGFIKATLALYHEGIPASLHFNELNPEIDFTGTPFFVNTKYTPWKKTPGSPRRAAVSSFGIGGTNAHAILEEAPEPGPSVSNRLAQLLTLSARSKVALETATSNLADHLRQTKGDDISDIAFTLHVGRKEFEHRRIVVCRGKEDAISQLSNLGATNSYTVRDKSDRNTVFMLPGQGAQFLGMARELFEHEAGFREQLERCSVLLSPYMDVGLTEFLYNAEYASPKFEEQIHETAMAQPAVFAIEYALAALWGEWGIRPDAMIGHSLGELTAACLAGVFSLEDGIRIVSTRARLMQSMPRGKMLAVMLPEREVAADLEEELVIAVVNGPSLCSVSGPGAAIDRYAAKLAERNIDYRPIRTSHAFHSPSMNEAAKEFSNVLTEFQLNPPAIPFVSNVTGAWINAAEATDPQYWGNQLRQTVRFAEGLEVLISDSNTVLIEVGPGRGLETLARMNARETRPSVFPSLAGAGRDQSDTPTMLETLGKLWALGVPIDWKGFHRHSRHNRVSAPTYPFQRERYWVDTVEETSSLPVKYAAKLANIADWFYVPTWTRTPLPEAIRQTDLDALKRHWLIFVDPHGYAAQVVTRLLDSGHEVTQVEVGARFEQSAEKKYFLEPSNPESYCALTRQLKRDARRPDCVFHCWSLQNTSDAEVDFDHLQSVGLFSLIYLAQALNAEYSGESIDISFISNQTQLITGNEKIEPAKSTVLSACVGITQEYPNLLCRHIDVDLRAYDSFSNFAETVLAESLQESYELLVGLRAQTRWVQSYLPFPIQETDRAGIQIRHRGVYCITGGLGKIGTIVANYLVRTAQARLVLVGRTRIPDRTKWDEWLSAHESSDPVSKKILQIQALEEAGAEVLVATVDVANAAQMEAVIRQARDQFGEKIHGVIHCAGITDSSAYPVLKNIDSATCTQHFRGKVRGLLMLEGLLRNDEPDFWLLFSSVSTALGGLGFIPYAAANHFLNSFATQRNKMGAAHWLSINWDGWHFDADNIDASADFGLTPEEGIQALQRILSIGSVSEIYVSPVDLFVRLDQWTNTSQFSDDSGARHANVYERPDLRTAYQAPNNGHESAISEIWQSLLGIENLGIDDNFFELGGHSLLAIQMVSRMQQLFHVEFSVQNLFDAPTVRELAANMSQLPARTGTDAIIRTLERVESLSEQQMEALLQEQGLQGDVGTVRSSERK